MTVAKLLRNKRFVRFCVLEYGIEADGLINADKAYLFKLMKYWFECPEVYMGPRGAFRDEVEEALKDGQLR